MRRGIRVSRSSLAILAILFALGCSQKELGGVSAHLAVRTQPVVLIAGQYVIDFGTVAVGATETRTVTALNTGKATLKLDAPLTPLPFAVDLLSQKVITNSGSLDLHFSFSPTSEGDAEQVIELHSDAGTVQLLLRGTGVGLEDCQYIVTPLRLDFGVETVNQTTLGATQFANVGSVDCELTDIHLEPTSDPAFALAAGQPSAGTATWTGGSFPLTVAFTPTVAGMSYTGTLSFRVGAQSMKVIVPITGTGVAPPVCSALETSCNNGVDDDCDGFLDCLDPDCRNNVAEGCPATDCGQGTRSESTPLALPDDGTGLHPYETSITIAGFAAGQKLNDLSKLLGVCVNMEHTWLRDLQIEAKSPDGSTVVLNQFLGRLGNAVFMGVPIDGDEGNPMPGTGWEYCWTPNAVNLPMLTYASQNGIVTLPAGDYQASGGFRPWQGAQLNGDWTIRVLDEWELDNGFIFSWTVKFDPTLVNDCSQWPG